MPKTNEGRNEGPTPDQEEQRKLVQQQEQQRRDATPPRNTQDTLGQTGRVAMSPRDLEPAAEPAEVVGPAVMGHDPSVQEMPGFTADNMGQGVGMGPKFGSPDPPSTTPTPNELTQMRETQDTLRKAEEQGNADARKEAEKRPLVSFQTHAILPVLGDKQHDETVPGGAYIMGDRWVNAEGREIQPPKGME